MSRLLTKRSRKFLLDLHRVYENITWENHWANSRHHRKHIHVVFFLLLRVERSKICRLTMFSCFFSIEYTLSHVRREGGMEVSEWLSKRGRGKFEFIYSSSSAGIQFVCLANKYGIKQWNYSIEGEREKKEHLRHR